MAIRLKLRKKDANHILCEALLGIDHFGFGTFLCNLKPEEIDADEFSKNALISAPSRSGLNGMEIWEDNRIAWGSPAHTTIMPVSEISNMAGSKGWLSKIKAKKVK